jgi:transcriptional regulator NrdR family protein
METNQSTQKNLPQDIRAAMQKREAVLRLSYSELVSGINRLLRQGIPKEVIAQVVTQAVDAVSKEFNPVAYQDFCARTETPSNVQTLP